MNESVINRRVLFVSAALIAIPALYSIDVFFTNFIGSQPHRESVDIGAYRGHPLGKSVAQDTAAVSIALVDKSHSRKVAFQASLPFHAYLASPAKCHRTSEPSKIENNGIASWRTPYPKA